MYEDKGPNNHKTDVQQARGRHKLRQLIIKGTLLEQYRKRLLTQLEDAEIQVLGENDTKTNFLQSRKSTNNDHLFQKLSQVLPPLNPPWGTR